MHYYQPRKGNLPVSRILCVMCTLSVYVYMHEQCICKYAVLVGWFVLSMSLLCMYHYQQW